MITHDAEILLSTFKRLFDAGFTLESSPHDEFVLVFPYSDSDGDPIKISIRMNNGTVALDDNASIAGQLFSLGQHTENTPAYQLLISLAKAYDCIVDFNEGLVRKVDVPRENFYESIKDLSKVIITMLTATPHIRTRPQRMRLLGPRLRRRIRETYEQEQIFKFVEPDTEIPGVAIEKWPADFHWRITENHTSRDVFVIAADLDTQDPLRKAERLCSLATDTKATRRDDYLRIVIDTHGQNSESSQASQFLRYYSQPLRYALYDFGDDEQRRVFLRESANEVLGEAGNSWRLFWEESRTALSTPNR